LGRSPSTISREIRRGQHRAGGYKAVLAERRAQQKARRPKPGKLTGCPRLHEEVQKRLDLKHSPEQIAARLRVDFPDQEQMQVSHETIYKALYVQGRGGLRKELTACLRTGRALRKPRARAQAGDKRGKIPGMVSIAERPPEVQDRAVPGHWEGDLITGAFNKSAIGTLVERTTGFVMLLHLPDGHTAEQVEQAMAKMSQLPEILRRTLTWDRGTEMTNHVQIAQALDLDIYFCDPHSPWQRGTNENTNGLLRQYFPKGTDLSGYTEHYLDYVADQLNNRPRKRLNWATPAEELDRLLSMPDPTVAFTA
jgi:IS30 family transposase